MRAVRELSLSLGIVEDTQNFRGTVLGAKRSKKRNSTSPTLYWVGCHYLFPALASDFPADCPKSLPDGEVIYWEVLVACCWHSHILLISLYGQSWAISIHWVIMFITIGTVVVQIAVLIFIFLPAQWATEVSLWFAVPCHMARCLVLHCRGYVENGTDFLMNLRPSCILFA